MENSKILSVSIAAYNVAKTLDQALMPFLDENVAPYVDVMIVDDGSKDDTVKVAEKYTAKLPDTFRIISKKNGGWGSTVNSGIAAAKGKYFKQLDGDDYFSLENLADFVAFLQKTDADMIHSPFVQFEDGSNAVISEIGGYGGGYANFILNETLRLDECGEYIPAMHCLTVKTDILRRNSITILEHCFYTDIEYMLKAYNYCDTICFYKKPVYYYRLARDGQSMSITGVRKHYKDHIRVLKEMLAFSDKHVTDAYKKENIDRRLLEACAFQYVFFFALPCTGENKKELKEYDSFLKKEYPVIYRKIDGRQISVLRKTNFIGYKLLAKQKMAKDKRLKRNFYEGR